MATITSVGSGLWSAPGTWDSGVPVDNDVVVIAAGHVVEFDVDQSGFANGIDGLTITGTLSLTRTTGTYYLKMKAATTINGAGTFDCGASALDPIPFTAKHNITGGAGWYIKGDDGAGMTLTVFAAEPTIKAVRTTGAEGAGQTVLEVDTDVTGDIWADGDTIAICNINKGMVVEYRTIAAGGIAAGSITVTAGLTASKLSGSYIALLTRNVRFSSNVALARNFTGSKVTIGGGEWYNSWADIFDGGTGVCSVSGGSFTGNGGGIAFDRPVSITNGVFTNLAYASDKSPTISDGYFLGNSFVGANITIITGGVFAGNVTVITSLSGGYVSGGTFIGNTNVIVSSFSTVLGGTFKDNLRNIMTGAILLFNVDISDGTYNLNNNQFRAVNSKFTYVVGYAGFSELVYSDSIDHNQVAGAYKAWTSGGVTTKQAVTVPTGYASSMQTVLESATKKGYWQKEIIIGAGASVNITMNLRKDASMAYLPRVIVFNKASVDPFAGGSGLYTFTMTNSVDTWEDDLYTYTNSGTEDVTLVIRCQGMNATGNMYSALLVEQINVDLTSATALINAIKAKTDQLAFTVANQVDANVKTLTDGLITKLKFDNSTAFPVEQEDAGTTELSRLDNTSTIAEFLAAVSTPEEVAGAVADEALAGHATPGSLGKVVSDIETSVSGLATTTHVQEVEDKLDIVDGIVDAVKAKTDNLPTLPAAIGSAMTLTPTERTAVANEVEAQIIDDTDAERVLTAITDKIASVNPSLDDLTLAGIASAVRAELTVELARIDAAISSRLAAAGYTAPANADVAAIKAKTDNLPSDPADQSILASLIAGLPAAPSVTDIINALKASVFDGLLTFEDSIRLYNAILFGKLDGGGTGILKFRDPADTKDRVTAVVDLNNGDRDDITLDLT